MVFISFSHESNFSEGEMLHSQKLNCAVKKGHSCDWFAGVNREVSFQPV